MRLLTPRDLALFDLLVSHVLLSYQQVGRLVFAERDHSTVMNRLRKLEDGGYIERHRVHRVRHPLLAADAGVVFQITMKGILEIQKTNASKTLPERVPSIHGRQIDHDLIVVEIAERLKKELAGERYENGAYLAGLNPGDPRPDGIFTNPDTGRRIALEVELSMKSADRLREILAAYRVRGRYGRVIYYVGNPTIGKRIASEVRGYNVQKLEDFEDRLFEVRLLQTGPEDSTPAVAAALRGAA